MDGVAVLRAALVESASLTAMVDPVRIAGGVMPQKTVLPAIALAQVSGTRLRTISLGATRHMTERVQVTVLARTYPQMKQVLKAVVQAADHARPVVSGVDQALVLFEADGPDFMDEAATIFMGTRDFLVSYNEAT